MLRRHMESQVNSSKSYCFSGSLCAESWYQASRYQFTKNMQAACSSRSLIYYDACAVGRLVIENINSYHLFIGGVPSKACMDLG